MDNGSAMWALALGLGPGTSNNAPSGVDRPNPHRKCMPFKQQNFVLSLGDSLTLRRKEGLTAMQGLCSASGWAPPSITKVGAYACTLHGRPIGLDTKVLVSGCARKLGPVLTRGGQVHRLIDEVLQHSANHGGGALVYADGPGVDDTYDKLRSMVARDSRVRAILAVDEPPGRLGRIALCRNVLIGEALSRLPDEGLLVTLDLDCMVNVASLWALLPSMMPHAGHAAAQGLARGARLDNNDEADSSGPAWDLLTGNSNPYRDLWALRSRRLGVDYDCWQDEKTMLFRGSCLRYRITIAPRAPVVRVRSAFNGVSVLRVGAVRARNASGCRYPDPSSTADSAPGLDGVWPSHHTGVHTGLDGVWAGHADASERHPLRPSLRTLHEEAHDEETDRNSTSGSTRGSSSGGGGKDESFLIRGSRKDSRGSSQGRRADHDAANRTGVPPLPRAVCEHVVLNECLHAHGLRIGIAPSLITSCPCGPICGDKQRFFYRVQIHPNGSLLVRDHRKRRPFTPPLWTQFIEPLCAAGASGVTVVASSNNKSLQSVVVASALPRPELFPLLKERVAPAAAPTAVC